MLHFPLYSPEELRTKNFRENNDVDVQFFVCFGTMCLCVLLADNQEIIREGKVYALECIFRSLVFLGTGGFSLVHNLCDLGFLCTNGNYVLNEIMPHTLAIHYPVHLPCSFSQ